MFQAFQFAGIPKVLKGLVVGGFTNTKDTPNPFGKSLEQLIVDHFGGHGYPIGFDFPIGHQEDNQAVVCGANCELIVNETVILSFNQL